MTAALDRPPLSSALGIPGARAVSLLDPEGPTVLWWAGQAAPSEQQIATVVALTSAAAGLVLLTEPGDELGDIILTSSDTFHVIRLVEGDTLRVAHLTLRRADANLAMARREFRELIEGREKPRPAEPPTLPRRERAGIPQPPPPEDTPAPTMPPDWFALINEPYSTDDGVLDRILDTLRNL
jgi:hypothetical protein